MASKTATSKTSKQPAKQPTKDELREIAIRIRQGSVAIPHEDDWLDIYALAADWLACNPESRIPDSLTARQLEIFLYIRQQCSKLVAPTVREIGAKFEIRSPNGVMCHLKAIERKGYIGRLEGLSRGIVVKEEWR